MASAQEDWPVTRFGWLTAICGGVFLVSVPLLPQRAPKVVWNASASVPIGLYGVTPVDAPHIGELVLVRPPAAIAAFLERRGYLAMGVPLLKHIRALPGQSVCRIDRTITVDGMNVGHALDGDHLGRTLPRWNGCRIIAQDEVFLMNWQSEHSFDGRYFGPLPATAILGRAKPLWIKDN